MKFHQVITNLLTPTTDHPLSRIYGYQITPEKVIKIIEAEANVIRMVIDALATRRNNSVDIIISDLLKQFLNDNIRNRSNKNWTRQSLLNLARPVYGGIVVSRMGIWKTSKIYPQIVSPSQVKAALKRIKTVKAA